MADMMGSQTGETLSLLKFRLNLIPRRIFPDVHASPIGAFPGLRGRAAIVSDMPPSQRCQLPASNSKVWPSRCQTAALRRTVKNQVCCSKGSCGLKHEG